MKTVLFQVTIDKCATIFTFNRSEKLALINKIIELKKENSKWVVDFLIINL